MEATLNGARIHYEREGQGLPVIFLHAAVADSRMWGPQMRAFAKHFDCIAPDLRGFGKSELPAEHWLPIADVLALVDHLDLKPAHIVGCSVGGGIAIDFALAHAERISKLVLVGPGVGGTNFPAKYPELVAEMEEAEKSGDQRAIVEADARFWLDGPRRPAGYVKDPIRKLFFEMDSNFDSDFESAPIDKIDPPAVDRLHEITAPTLVVVGDEDMPPVFDAVELLMEKVPHARKAVIHDAAHLPNLEHPDEFNRIVLEFLAL
ncbi:MAG TPA: alpha/beta fold hydrolase [Candidatus Dormibacteraeota bacterium]|nr:alpha/beta fold hydrolase [Candidatus Dormibacteraeota bacterium]